MAIVSIACQIVVIIEIIKLTDNFPNYFMAKINLKISQI